MIKNDARRFTSTATVNATLVEDGFDGDVFRQLYDVEASFVIGYYQFFDETQNRFDPQWYFGVTGTEVVEYKTQNSFRWVLLDSGGFVKISSDQFHDVELLNPGALLCSGVFIPNISIGHIHKELEIGSKVIKAASISGTSISIWCGETSITGTGFCGNLGGNMESDEANTTDLSTPTGIIKGVLRSPATFETGSAGNPVHSAVVELYRQNSEVRDQNEDESIDKYIQFLIDEGRSFVHTITIKQEDFSVFQFEDVPIFESIPTDGSEPIEVLYTIQVSSAKTEIIESDDSEVANDVEIEYFNDALPNIISDASGQLPTHKILLLPIESYVVNSTGDDRDENPSDGSCDTGNVISRDGKQELECTLRAAIDEANWNLGVDRIIFDIPGLLSVISPKSGLPKITDPVMIDGTTQSDENNNGITTIITGVMAENGTPETPTITLDGRLAGRANGLHITAEDSVVTGMIISNFNENGIFLEDGDGNRIEGNFICIDEGDRAQGNKNGIVILNSSNNIIKGNMIGTSRDSNVVLGNGKSGVVIQFEGVGNVIGGSEEGAGNVISGNNDVGVFVGDVNGFFLSKTDDIDDNHNIVQGNVKRDRYFYFW